MKPRKLIVMFSITLTVVSAILFSCQKEHVFTPLSDKKASSVMSSNSTLVAVYSNPLNPYDYIGSRHNNVVNQLKELYRNLPANAMEDSIIERTPDVIKEIYPTEESSNIDLSATLNNINGFEGNWRDIDIKENYIEVIYASSNSGNVNGTFINFVSDITNLASNMISKHGIYTQVSPNSRAIFKEMFMNAFIQVENQYIDNINAADYTSQEKAILFSAMAVFRYSIDMNTDELTPIPDPSANGEINAVRKWIIALADAVGAVIGGAAAGSATFGWGTALGALEGAAAASGIAALF